MGRNQWINLTAYYRSRGNKDVNWAPHSWNPRALLLLSFCSTFEEVPSSSIPSISLMCFTSCKELCYTFFFLLPWCLPAVPMCNALIYCRNCKEFGDMFGPTDCSQYMCYSSPELLHTPLLDCVMLMTRRRGLHEPNLLWLFRHNFMMVNTYTEQIIQTQQKT
jgi:hypothetical protein